ncbi:hypothetical protein HNP00_001043 [Arthrobacter sp. AZCC_0090]|nr:hypothetical protein [Arthrobacter sp. AZCC_0090]
MSQKPLKVLEVRASMRLVNFELLRGYSIWDT